jgi:fermentation-respiration switch protein FrsA (DUF1100 family)
VVAELATEHLPAGSYCDHRSPTSPRWDRFTTRCARRALLKDGFPVAKYLARVAVPITLVYATEDSIVPPPESRASVVAARGPTRLVAVEGTDHNDPALLNGMSWCRRLWNRRTGSTATRIREPTPEPTTGLAADPQQAPGSVCAAMAASEQCRKVTYRDPDGNEIGFGGGLIAD